MSEFFKEAAMWAFLLFIGLCFAFGLLGIVTQTVCALNGQTHVALSWNPKQSGCATDPTTEALRTYNAVMADLLKRAKP